MVELFNSDSIKGIIFEFEAILNKKNFICFDPVIFI